MNEEWIKEKINLMIVKHWKINKKINKQIWKQEDRQTYFLYVLMILIMQPSENLELSN